MEPNCAYRQPHTETTYLCRNAQVVAQGGIIPRQVCQYCTLYSDMVDIELLRKSAESSKLDLPVQNPVLPEPQRIPDDGPGFVQMGLNFAKALTKHVATGAKYAPQEVVEARLTICNTCPYRAKDRCTHAQCGCSLSKKTLWKNNSCPIGKWRE